MANYKKKKLTLMSVDKSFEQGYSEFIGYCKARNLRPATIKHYDNIINYTWYKFLPKETAIADITLQTVYDFMEYCRALGNGDTTVNTNVRAIRAILYYFMRLGYMDEFQIVEPKRNPKPIETYTDAELKLLLAKPDMKKCRFSEYRNWVICNFLLATGARLSTLVELRVEDLDFENELIAYRHTKNRKRQVVPMSSKLKLVLQEYVAYIDGEGVLFPNSYGEPISQITITHGLQYYNQRRGVMKTGVHRWRHTFAKKWILSGGDIFRLQKMLGHSSMEIVKNYVNMFTDDLQRDFDTFNPLETMTEPVRSRITVRDKRSNKRYGR